MSEKLKSAVTDSLAVPSSPLGPTSEDVASYADLLAAVNTGESVGYSPRTSAELTFGLIDKATLGSFINSDAETNGLDTRSARRIGQQRYIAGVLGLKVYPTVIDGHGGTASFTATIPEDYEVPPVPPQDSNKKFTGPDGQPLRPVQRDMVFSSRFLAANRAIFSQPQVFEELAYNVTQQAEGGMLTVGSHPSDPIGAMSLQRQIARVLGYEVDVYTKQANGTYTMPVSGIRKGFDDRFTHFKDKNGLNPKDQLGL